MSNIIMIFHVPIDNLTKSSAIEFLNNVYQETKSDEYKTLVFPYEGGKPKKILIDVIDFNNIKNNIDSKMIKDMMKNQLAFLEKAQWERLTEIEKYLNNKYE